MSVPVVCSLPPLLVLPQVNLLWLIPLHVLMGTAFATCYIRVGGIPHPVLQAMATQFCSYCVSVGIDQHYRRLYRRRRAEEAALFAPPGVVARAAYKQKALLAEEAAKPTPQVGGWRAGRLSCLPIAHCSG